ncbi:conserved Plasmodium protein, unknown function [Plasmodium ovale wallikeri]|uniref:Uncharacterized protein n=1 Tax=Plasmodium ovale wallikeri TaxID=864142 RepID=A0A1A8ZZE7_PLAOA|nr:conserved Plasmodium protein, unknown function [Plasmodium ovale wallikeri]SBT49738.1 conserved Plasmodium protein, unknown function [Plasmodium ovale wallikeri]
MALLKHVPIPSSFTVNRNIRRFNMAENDRKIFFSVNLFSILLFALPMAYLSTANYKICEENEIVHNKLSNTGLTVTRHICSTQHKLVLDEMRSLSRKYEEKWKSKNFLKYIKRKSTSYNITIDNFPYCNLQLFNEIINLLYTYEYAKIGIGDNKDVFLLTKDIHYSIHKITKSILCVYFFFMKNAFSYFVQPDLTTEKKRDVDKRKNIMNNLLILKKLYFHLYIVLFSLNMQGGNLKDQEKKRLYRNIRETFKSKYKSDYEMMKIRQKFMLPHHVYKIYFVLASYRVIIEKKTKLFFVQQCDKVPSEYFSKVEEETVSLLTESLILLRSEKINSEKCNKNYELVQGKLRNSIYLLNLMKKGIQKKCKQKMVYNTNHLHDSRKCTHEHTSCNSVTKENTPDSRVIYEAGLDLLPHDVTAQTTAGSGAEIYHVYYCENGELSTGCEEITCEEGSREAAREEARHNFLATQYLMHELRHSFKREKNYVYVSKKLCYDKSKNDFCMEEVSPMESLLPIGMFRGRMSHSTKQPEGAKSTDVDKHSTEGSSYQIHTQNVREHKYEQDQENSEADLLKPMGDASSFRRRIATSLLQGSLTSH